MWAGVLAGMYPTGVLLTHVNRCAHWQALNRCATDTCEVTCIGGFCRQVTYTALLMTHVKKCAHWQALNRCATDTCEVTCIGGLCQQVTYTGLLLTHANKCATHLYIHPCQMHCGHMPTCERTTDMLLIDKWLTHTDRRMIENFADNQCTSLFLLLCCPIF